MSTILKGVDIHQPNSEADMNLEIETGDMVKKM